MERSQAAHIVPADQCRPVLALALAADAFAISNKTTPAIDCSCFFSPNLAVPGVDLQRNSFGLAVQLDGDIRIDGNWSVSLDVKYVQIRTDQKAGGSAIGEVKVDPMIDSLGLGYRS